MSSLDLLAASGVAIGAAGLAALLVPPTTRLGTRYGRTQFCHETRSVTAMLRARWWRRRWRVAC